MDSKGNTFPFCNAFLFFFFFSLSFSQIPKPGRICGRRYCIFQHANMSTSFKMAQDLCFANESYLVELTDRQTNRVLNQFIGNNPGLSRRRVLLNSQVQSEAWRCIDQGKFSPFEGGAIIKARSSLDRYLTLVKVNGSFVAKADSNLNSKSALCSIPLDSEKACSDRFEAHYNFLLGHSCYFSVYGAFNWYEATNQCQQIGNATLATFHHANALSLLNKNSDKWVKKFSETSYWLGCASEVWDWSYSNIPIIKSHWFLDSPSGNSSLKCSYFIVNDLGNAWLKGDCSEEYTVLCMTDKLHPTKISSSSLNTANPMVLLTLIVAGFTARTL